jgi:beta-barrel assembly-enhancing protease
VHSASFTGRYSDGRTAATHAVKVRLDPDALDITWDDLDAAERWPYASLDTATPVHWKDNQVLLRSPQRPGATLFVSDPGFASALLKNAPKLSAGAHRWRYAIPGLAIVGALGLLVGSMYAFNWQPAKTVAGWIPRDVRVAIGQRAALNLSGDHAECTAPAGNKALDEMVSALSAASGNPTPFHVRVVHWDIINAFAVPGEQIVISGNLINEADTPEEVAGVIAHEMGHGIELHPEAGIVRSLGLSAIIELLASGQSGTLTNTGALLLELNYSREAEHEADTHALRILKSADVSPHPLSVFFKKLLKLEGGVTADAGTEPKDKTAAGTKGDKPADTIALPPLSTSIFSTHPPTPERAKMAEDAATYPGHAVLSTSSWDALKHICD